MEINEEAARKMLVAMGRTSAADKEIFTRKKLVVVLNKADKLLEEGDLKEPENRDDKVLWRRIMTVLSEEGDGAVQLEGEAPSSETTEVAETTTNPQPAAEAAEQPADTVEATEPSKKARKKKGTKTMQAKTNPRRPSNGSGRTTARTNPKGNVDKFGSRVGSLRSKVNARISKRPKTFQQLAEEAGMKNTFFRKHMKRLVKEGYVKPTDKGFVLA